MDRRTSYCIQYKEVQSFGHLQVLFTCPLACLSSPGYMTIWKLLPAYDKINSKRSNRFHCLWSRKKEC